MKGQMRHWSCAVGALVLGAVLGFPAQAARNPENMTVSGVAKRPMEQVQTARRQTVTRSIVVAYGDLDLSAQSEARTLYGHG